MFKEAFKITNNSIILAAPMIICLTIFELYTKSIKFANTGSEFKFLFVLTTVVFMVGALSAGFFYMIKRAIEINNNVLLSGSERKKEILDLFKRFPEGISEYFWSFSGAYTCYVALEILVIPIVLMLGYKLFGGFNSELLNTLITALSANSDNILDKLTDAQLLILFKWFLLFFVIIWFISYFLLLFVPEIIYNTKNPLKAMFKSIGKVFNNFWKMLGLYLLISFVSLLIMILAAVLQNNLFLRICTEIVKYYFCLYFIFVIFIFYNKKYITVENADSKEE